MAHVIYGLFKDSKQAGKTIGILKEKGYTDSISIIAKDEQGQVSGEVIKDTVAEGAATGAVTGAAVGVLAGILAGITSVVIPGAGLLFLAGPLTAGWVAGGALTGLLTGGLVGALVDAGLTEEQASLFEESIKRGEVLVSVIVEHENEATVEKMLMEHSALQVITVHEV